MDFLAFADFFDVFFTFLLDFIDVALKLRYHLPHLVLVGLLLAELVLENCFALDKLFAIAVQISDVSAQVSVLADDLVGLFLLGFLRGFELVHLVLDLLVLVPRLPRLLLYLVRLRLQLGDQVLQCFLLVGLFMQKVIFGIVYLLLVVEDVFLGAGDPRVLEPSAVEQCLHVVRLVLGFAA